MIKLKNAKSILLNPLERSSYDLNMSDETNERTYDSDNSFEYESKPETKSFTVDEEFFSQNVHHSSHNSRNWWETKV